MNMAVHGLTGVIKSGDEANTFYHDAHNLNGCCDYVMANPPFNVDKVKSESAQSAGRLPFGPVSYTHLDVYKRQGELFSAAHRLRRAGDRGKGGGPVSYTHLDVYKRQGPETG